MFVKSRWFRLLLSQGLVVVLYMGSRHDRHDVKAVLRPSRDGPGVLHLSFYVIPDYVQSLGFGVANDVRGTLGTLTGGLSRSFKNLRAEHIAVGSKADVRVTKMYIALVTFIKLYSLRQDAAYKMRTVTISVY